MGRCRSTNGSSPCWIKSRGPAKRKAFSPDCLTRATPWPGSPRIFHALRLSSTYTRWRALSESEFDGVKDANPPFVGLPDLPPDLSFSEQYSQHFRPRLGKRADGFDALFQPLQALGRSLLVVETGCLRIPGNWQGDGQSTFMFDALVRTCGGVLISIDVTSECIDTARKACSSATQLLQNDSVSALNALAQVSSRQIDLLYLDSFDLNAGVLPSAIHHALELTAARPLIGSGTVICIDDYAVGSSGGKGMIVDKFLTAVRAEVLYSGYQKIWRIR